MAHSRSFPFTSTGTVGPSFTNGTFVKLYGWCLSETGGTTAETVTLKDANGIVVAFINIPKSTTVTQDFHAPILVDGHVAATAAGGTLSGVLYLI